MQKRGWDIASRTLTTCVYWGSAPNPIATVCYYTGYRDDLR